MLLKLVIAVSQLELPTVRNEDILNIYFEYIFSMNMYVFPRMIICNVILFGL